MNDDIEKMLADREVVYGQFHKQGELSQLLKEMMLTHENWYDLDSYQKEALHMIQHKIARIINGDPDYIDNWLDIAGYALLVRDRIEELDK